MSAGVRDLLVRGVAAAKANEPGEARRYLEWALRLNPSIDQRLEALYWLSEISKVVTEKRRCLEEILAHQPNHFQARRSMAVLDGRLDPQDTIDPDNLPDSSSSTESLSQKERFECPQCGGRLTFTPDGNSLICEYCASQQRKVQIDPEPTFNWHDFTATLATVKGHTRPVSTPSFTCQSCGAVFLQPPGSASLSCPYCAAVYVAGIEDAHELIPPEGLLPFIIGKSTARQNAQVWLTQQEIKTKSLAAFQGIYQPVWVFSISGKVIWSYLERHRTGWVPRAGDKLVIQDSRLTPGNKTLPAEWTKEWDSFNLIELVPFSTAYLANWPAEVYQISVSDASLNLRWRLLEELRQEILQGQSSATKDFKIDASNLIVTTFKWIMVPIWMSSFISNNQHYPIFVNGQSGQVLGDNLTTQTRNWLSRLFPK